MTTPSISNLGKGQSEHVLCNNTNPAQTIDCYVSYMITFGTFSRILTELNLRTEHNQFNLHDSPEILLRWTNQDSEAKQRTPVCWLCSYIYLFTYSVTRTPRLKVIRNILFDMQIWRRPLICM